MKKVIYLSFLLVLVFLAWCGSKDKKEEEVLDITETEFSIEACDKYFGLMDCIIENEEFESFTPEMRNELRKEIKDFQAERNQLDDEILHEKCTDALNDYKNKEEKIIEVWCGEWLPK